MASYNFTLAEKFTLLGFSHLPHLRFLLICMFLFLYTCTLLGNSLIILLIIKDHRLHNPMYFFLANLSVLDLLSPSVTVPKMIKDLVSGKGDISFHGCFIQIFFYITFVAPECPLLSVMAFDRYVAICKPLHYRIIMSKKMCSWLTGGIWIVGSFYSLLHTLMTKNIHFCGPFLINHVFCDVLPLLQLACSDITLNLASLYISVFFNVICNFSIILSSYSSIVTVIARTKYRGGRMKTFSTCSSHLMVVSVYYFTVLATYFHPVSSYSESKDRAAIVVYTAVTPALNPIIYSFRNNNVKKALKKLF
ncbi:olfactory receptor 5V1-like [Xenopus laevis]|uniref:G-protein coupled receptors family 1 profile domain-containing protein n=2 Tax=Xenopus laevis TaxID=8355 RepID=A0A974C198_XENLA|nr:olfactory receptor 5V1-like [Xenopus laevis]OCT64694.1 hypothetical protein XELAEV_18045791mg [Xenopus laevis]